MERYAYSLDQRHWVGVFESREQATRACLRDHEGEFEPRTSVIVWTAVAGRSPRAGELVPSGEELLGVMKASLVRGEAAEEGFAWFEKLEGLPEETLERLRVRVVDAVDNWVTALGLQPRFFPVDDIQQHSSYVLPPEKRGGG